MIVLKARFRDQASFLAAFDQEIPNGGVFCPTTQELKPDEEVIVELYFPELPNKVMLRGTVVSWRAALPRLRVRAGALIAFSDAEQEKKDFILAVANGDTSIPAIKRKHPRLPIDLECTWREANSNEDQKGGLKDISIGGAQLVTTQSLKTNAFIYVEFLAPGGAQPVEVAANVTYRTPLGYGLKFQYRDGGGSRRLREIIRRLVSSD